jgi:hypothetical protein
MESKNYIFIVFFILSVLLNFSFIGVFLNMNVMIKNQGKMPVYSDVIYNSDSDHFYFNNYSEVNFPFLADIHQLETKEYIISYSIGDIFIILSIFSLLAYAIFLSIMCYKIIKNGKNKSN